MLNIFVIASKENMDIPDILPGRITGLAKMASSVKSPNQAFEKKPDPDSTVGKIPSSGEDPQGTTQIRNFRRKKIFVKTAFSLL